MSVDANVERILLISSEPEQELELLEWCLKRLQNVSSAELHVIAVLPELDSSIKRWLSQKPQAHQLEQWVLDENQRREVMVEMAKSTDVTLCIHVCFGKLFYDSIQYARFHQVDLVVKRVQPNSQNGQNLLFDSQDMHLLRKCPMPLLLYKHGTSLPFETVMASVDVCLKEHLEVDDNPELNQHIFYWAQWLNCQQPMHITHAWQEGVEFYAKHWSIDLEDQEFNELSESTFRQHQAALNQSIQQMNFHHKPVVHYLNGEAVDSICQATQSLSTDVLVMGTLARSGLAGFLIGNTAEQVLEAINCSVLAIKPEGFVSPIPPPKQIRPQRVKVATD